MVDYDLVKVTIDATRLAGVIFDVVVQHHGLLDSIILIKICFLSQSLGYCFVTSSESGGNSLPPLSSDKQSHLFK